MAHTGNTCGAVTGGLMVISMKYGRTCLDDLAAKDKTYETVNVFIAEFLRRNHSLNCTDLIGHNLSDPNALALARERKLFHTKCAKFVRDAGEILETVLRFCIYNSGRIPSSTAELHSRGKIEKIVGKDPPEVSGRTHIVSATSILMISELTAPMALYRTSL